MSTATAVLAASASALHDPRAQSSLVKPQVSTARNSTHISTAVEVVSMRRAPKIGNSIQALNRP